MIQFKNKQSVIRVINTITGEHIFSHTDNVKKRSTQLTNDIKSIRGEANGKVFPRFQIFANVDTKDILFELYAGTVILTFDEIGKNS